jgi:hypothetical protein
MPLASETVDFMKFLNKNPVIRSQIKAAPPRKTLVYAGKWKSETWREISVLQAKGDSRLEGKELLPQVLRRILLAGSPNRSLLNVRISNRLDNYTCTNKGLRPTRDGLGMVEQRSQKIPSGLR